ncbi:MAG: hypothetical protein LBS91_07690 [Clostridiales Family XIII bacterium]|jgi:small-conductance mechanosensitive channel|nr:hypothetical protein [Clostridiales Family XIII bacterium]
MLETLATVAARIRLSMDNPIAVLIIAVLACSAVIYVIHSVLNFLFNTIILGRAKGDTDRHPLNIILKWLTVALIAAALLIVILPAAGIDLLPFSLLTLLGRT